MVLASMSAGGSLGFAPLELPRDQIVAALNSLSELVTYSLLVTLYIVNPTTTVEAAADGDADAEAAEEEARKRGGDEGGRARSTRRAPRTRRLHHVPTALPSPRPTFPRRQALEKSQALSTYMLVSFGFVVVVAILGQAGSREGAWGPSRRSAVGGPARRRRPSRSADTRFPTALVPLSPPLSASPGVLFHRLGDRRLCRLHRGPLVPERVCACHRAIVRATSQSRSISDVRAPPPPPPSSVPRAGRRQRRAAAEAARTAAAHTGRRKLTDPILLSKKYLNRWTSRVLGRPLHNWPKWNALHDTADAVDDGERKRRHLLRLGASIRGAELAGEGLVLRWFRHWTGRWLPDRCRSGFELGVTSAERTALLDEASAENARTMQRASFDWDKGRLFLANDEDEEAGQGSRPRRWLSRYSTHRRSRKAKRDAIDRVESTGGVGGGVGEGGGLLAASRLGSRRGVRVGVADPNG